MVGIVIIHIRSVERTLEFHPASGAVEGSQASLHRLTGNSHHPRHTGCRQGIDRIVVAKDRQCEVTILLSITNHIKLPPVVGNIGSMDAIPGIETERHKVQALQGLHGIGIIAVGQDSAGGQTGKRPEGLFHICKVLKIIQVVCFNVQNHRQSGKEIQERIAVFTAFQQNRIAIAHSVTSMQQGQIAPDHHCRVHLGSHENMGNHRGCGGLAMGAGNADGILVRLHNDTPRLGSLKHRNTQCPGTGNLRVVIMHRSGTNNAVCIANILRPVADLHTNTLGNQLIGGNRGIHIRAGNDQSHTLQHKTQRTHGYAADTDQMDLFPRLYKFLKF